MSRFKLANLIAYGFVSLFSIYVLMPIIVMVLTTFKSKREIFLEPLGLPSQFGLSSFEKALSVGLGSFMLNSLIVSFFAVFLIVTISGMAAYVLSRIDFKFNKFVYLLIVAGFAIPPAAVLVPLYTMAVSYTHLTLPTNREV